jgi:multicomponent Na+:H+ antiporter subunit G
MTTIFEICDYISWFCLILGSIFCIIGGVGLLRLPDFYCRTHGATITDTLGAGLILLGLLVQSVHYLFDAQGNWQTDAWLIPVKLLFVGAFILCTSPTSGHALVKAAHADGVSWVQEGDDAVSE